MLLFKNEISKLSLALGEDKASVVVSVRNLITNAGYTIVEVDEDKPWGAYFRLDGKQADDFVREFFPGLSIEEARLNIPGVELSPKILLVSPAQRLSWQYHDRRAERWAFLTAGAYNKSQTDDPGELKTAKPGDVVQFAQSERHRLVGDSNAYSVVAEIWQHTDPNNHSNEDDITRLSDDYSR